MEQVVIIMGSPSDEEKMRPAFDILKELDVDAGVYCLSAHRAHEELSKIVEEIDNCPRTGAVIAGAGMSAALPGVIAAQTVKPVIGVPLSGSKLNGEDALYSIAQMPPGIPVATVGIDAAKNAGLLAAQIMAGEVPGHDLARRIYDWRAAQTAKNLRANKEIHQKYRNGGDEDWGRHTQLC